jgi:hypothetical protein
MESRNSHTPGDRPGRADPPRPDRRTAEPTRAECDGIPGRQPAAAHRAPGRAAGRPASRPATGSPAPRGRHLAVRRGVSHIPYDHRR